MADVERRGFLGWLRARHRELRSAAAGIALGAAVAWMLGLTGQTAPLWTFVGVVVVALLTVATAESRHERQLEAESGRLRQQLDGEAARQMQQLEAESTRHAERLAHERSTAAREDNVVVAEEALRAFREADRQMRSLEATGVIAQLAARVSAASAVGPRPVGAELRSKIFECRGELERIEVRMSVRLRRDSKQLRAFREAKKEFERSVGPPTSIATVLNEPREGGPDRNQILRQRQAFSRRVDEFEDAVSSHAEGATS